MKKQAWNQELVDLFDSSDNLCSYSGVAVLRVFPTLIYQKQILRPGSPLNRELLKECYKFSEIDRAGQVWSKKNYPGGYTSYGSLSNLYDLSPHFAELRKKIDREVAIYTKNLEMNIRKNSLKMVSLWINIVPKGVYHTMHIHPLSVISGTYYLRTPKGIRGLKLEDPRLVNYMASPPRKPKASLDNQRFVELSPSEGEVLLFESWLRHEVPANPVGQDRISISFNYDWT